MRSRAEIVVSLIDCRVVAVVRLSNPDKVMPVCEALIEGGIRSIELTFTIPGVVDLLRRVRENFGAQLLLGAGSVLTAQQAHSAVAAGADFIVSPVGRIGLIQAAHELNRPVMLGALTPTEAENAHAMGADFVKLFPADCFGLEYLRSLLAPLPHLRMVPTGGIHLENIREYFSAGATLVGVGSALVSAELVEASSWVELKARARAFSSRTLEIKSG